MALTGEQQYNEGRAAVVMAIDMATAGVAVLGGITVATDTITVNAATENAVAETVRVSGAGRPQQEWASVAREERSSGKQ